MKLSNEQAKYLEAAEWIFSDTRRVGKTTLILYVILRKAIKFPGMQIPIVDHNYIYQPYFEITILRELEAMIKDEEFSSVRFIINKINRTIMVKTEKENDKQRSSSVFQKQATGRKRIGGS